MSKLIDGKVISTAVKERVNQGVAEFNEQGVTVGLAVIIVGEDPASKVYVANKKKACETLGIISEEYALPENTTEEELLALINELNGKKSINGIKKLNPSLLLLSNNHVFRSWSRSLKRYIWNFKRK